MENSSQEKIKNLTEERENRNRSRGVKRIEDYVMSGKIPPYNDLKTFVLDHTREKNRCIFCRNTEKNVLSLVENSRVQSGDYGICSHCQENYDFMTDNVGGMRKVKRIHYKEGIIAVFYYKNSVMGLNGWAYSIEVPSRGLKINFSSKGDSYLFSKKQYAITAGLSRLISVLKTIN